MAKVKGDPRAAAKKYATPYMHSLTVADKHGYVVKDENKDFTFLKKGSHFMTIKNGTGNWSHVNANKPGETATGSHYGSLNTHLRDVHNPLKEQAYDVLRDKKATVNVAFNRVKNGKTTKDVIGFDHRVKAEDWIKKVENHPEIKNARIAEAFSNGQSVKVISGPHSGKFGSVEGVDDHTIVTSDRDKRGILKRIARVRINKNEEPLEIATNRLKKLRESEPPIFVKHPNWGQGRMVPGQFTANPDGWSMDVMFEHGIERGVTGKDLLITEEDALQYIIEFLRLTSENE